MIFICSKSKINVYEILSSPGVQIFFISQTKHYSNLKTRKHLPIHVIIMLILKSIVDGIFMLPPMAEHHVMGLQVQYNDLLELHYKWIQTKKTKNTHTARFVDQVLISLSTQIKIIQTKNNKKCVGPTVFLFINGKGHTNIAHFLAYKSWHRIYLFIKAVSKTEKDWK